MHRVYGLSFFKFKVCIKLKKIRNDQKLRKQKIVIYKNDVRLLELKNK